MKADGLFIITAFIFIFIAWVATGGPSRPIAKAGPYITPITRSGEESQGYRVTPPSNPLDVGAYPRRIGTTISSGRTTSGVTAGTSAKTVEIHIERSTAGAMSGNPNQEYVTLANAGTATVTVTGWLLKSKATGTSVTIPTLGLAPNQTGTIVSGRGAADQLTNVCTAVHVCVYLNRNLEMYAQSNETITLINSSGQVADTLSY